MSVTTLLASFAEARNLADQIDFQSYNALQSQFVRKYFALFDSTLAFCLPLYRLFVPSGVRCRASHPAHDCRATVATELSTWIEIDRYLHKKSNLHGRLERSRAPQRGLGRICNANV